MSAHFTGAPSRKRERQRAIERRRARKQHPRNAGPPNPGALGGAPVGYGILAAARTLVTSQSHSSPIAR